MKTLLKKTIAFLNKIGVETYIVDNFEELIEVSKVRPFIKNILIKEGKLFCHPEVRVSSVLHEAGHLAVLHPKYRKLVNGNIASIIKKMSKEINIFAEEKYMYCEDLCATAWAWAVGKHLKIPEKYIIEDYQYQECGKDIRSNLKAICYAGINQLQHAEFCVTKERIKCLEKFKDLPVYPQLGKWLQN